METMSIQRFTWDEIDSMVESTRAVIPQEDDDELFNTLSDFDAFEVEGTDGEWALLEVDGHVLAECVVDEIQYVEAVHVGVVAGPCGDFCQSRQQYAVRAKIELLHQRAYGKIRCFGFEWELQASANYGEPEWVSDAGYAVLNPPWTKSNTGRPSWSAGDSDGGEFGEFSGRRSAMKAVVDNFKAKRRRSCEHCGHVHDCSGRLSR